MKHNLFSHPPFATAVEGAWTALPEHFRHVALDEFVVMPNHFHGLLWVVNTGVVAQHAAPLRPSQPRVLPGSVGTIVRSFKSAATKEINELRGTLGAPVWQHKYWDRIVRDDRELDRIREYIRNNPLKWRLDRENPASVRDANYDRDWGWLEGAESHRP